MGKYLTMSVVCFTILNLLKLLPQVFLLPLVLMEDASSVLAHSFVVFFVTFAFCGLELVAIEVDDPFGKFRLLSLFRCDISGI